MRRDAPGHTKRELSRMQTQCITTVGIIPGDYQRADLDVLEETIARGISALTIAAADYCILRSDHIKSMYNDFPPKLTWQQACDMTGDMYEYLAERFGVKSHTLRTYAAVMRSWPYEWRTSSETFTPTMAHYQAIGVRLPEYMRKQVLDEVVGQELSVEETRRMAASLLEPTTQKSISNGIAGRPEIIPRMTFDAKDWVRRHEIRDVAIEPRTVTLHSDGGVMVLTSESEIVVLLKETR